MSECVEVRFVREVHVIARLDAALEGWGHVEKPDVGRFAEIPEHRVLCEAVPAHGSDIDRPPVAFEVKGERVMQIVWCERTLEKRPVHLTLERQEHDDELGASIATGLPHRQNRVASQAPSSTLAKLAL